LKSKVQQYKAQQARDQRRKDSQKFDGKKHKLGFNDRVSINNYKNSLYYGKLYLGEQFSEMQVIVDTSSDWLMIEGQECEDCKENKYDPNTSNYYTVINDIKKKKNYGNIVQTKVIEVQDQVCLKFDDGCIQPFRFQLVMEQQGIPEQVDGILGLAQGKDPRSDQDSGLFPNDFSLGPLWLDYLEKGGWITEKTFSTHFEGEAGESYIDLGPPDSRSLSAKEYTVDIFSQKGFFYEVFPEGIRFGDNMSFQQYKLEN